MAMTSATRSRARYRTGIALTPTQLCAVDMRLRSSTDRAWRAELEPPPTELIAVLTNGGGNAPLPGNSNPGGSAFVTSKLWR